MSQPPIRLTLDTPQGPVPLTSQTARTLLPRGLNPTDPSLTYGEYLDALARLARRGGGAFLCRLYAGELPCKSGVITGDAASGEACERLIRDEWGVEEIEIRGEKHGAFYQVARVIARTSGGLHSRAVNSAIGGMQKAQLDRDYRLLRRLEDEFGLSWLPRPLTWDRIEARTISGEAAELEVFAAEWFEGFDEFHLSAAARAAHPPVHLWNGNAPGVLLDSRETGELYRKAAFILSSYLNPETFEEIYPWHHAAGDFVARRTGGGVDARLITVRDYRCVSRFPDGGEAFWARLLFSFFNLTLRMRIDRVEGTGELALAGPECLRGTVAGFLEAWEDKRDRDPDLPSARDVLELFQGLDGENWAVPADLALEWAMVDEEEFDFIVPRLNEHIALLMAALR